MHVLPSIIWCLKKIEFNHLGERRTLYFIWQYLCYELSMFIVCSDIANIYHNDVYTQLTQGSTQATNCKLMNCVNVRRLKLKINGSRLWFMLARNGIWYEYEQRRKDVTHWRKCYRWSVQCTLSSLFIQMFMHLSNCSIYFFLFEIE